MKTTNFLKAVTLASFTFFLLSSCGQGGGGGNSGNGGTVATTPQSCTNPNDISCGQQFYGQNGWVSCQPTTNSTCLCPSTHRPVSNPNLGIGCMPINQFNGFVQQYPYVYFYSWNSVYSYHQPYFSSWVSNPQPTNLPQMGYIPASNYSVAQACDVRLANSCGPQAQCAAVSGGSTVGLCVGQFNAAQGIYPQQNCRFNGFFWSCSYNYGYGSQFGYPYFYGGFGVR